MADEQTNTEELNVEDKQIKYGKNLYRPICKGALYGY